VKEEELVLLHISTLTLVLRPINLVLVSSAPYLILDHVSRNLAFRASHMTNLWPCMPGFWVRDTVLHNYLRPREDRKSYIIGVLFVLMCPLFINDFARRVVLAVPLLCLKTPNPT
jgi:hypothetical protein